MERPRFLRPQYELERIGAGKRTEAFLVENRAVKLVRDVKSEVHARELAILLAGQYRLFQEYLENYVLPTSFVIGDDEQSNIVLAIIQPYVQGVSLKEAIIQAREEGRDIPYIRDFFHRALKMERETGYIPDMFGKLFDTYNPLQTRNVIVTKQEEEYIPLLIDTNFSRQSERVYGPYFHNKLLARSINNLLQTL